MDPVVGGIGCIAIVIVLIMLRIHIGISMGLMGLLGSILIIGEPGINLAKVMPFGVLTNFEWIVLPMFILMGMVASESGIASSLFQTAQKWLGAIKGGLLMATTLSMGIFGACSGSSFAAAATFTKIAYPELIKNKFHPGLSGGAIAAAGTQSALIPPSALLVLYGILADQSIAHLLLAALIPGAISVLSFLVIIQITLRIYPKLGPKKIKYPFKEKLLSLRTVWPIPVIFIGVIGGIYFGVFTPTEAGAAGAFLTILVAVINIGYKNANIPKALKETATTGAMIFFVLLSANIFTHFCAFTNIPKSLGAFIVEKQMSPMSVILIILMIYIILGCVFDAIGVMAITIPILYPILEISGIDGIWFGILVVKVVEIGLITPPIGMNVFVVRATALASANGKEIVSTGQLFVGILPFLIADMITLTILIIFPQISLYLPGRI